MNIHEPSPEVAKHLARWSRARDVIEGEDAVKAKGKLYLPPAGERHKNQSEYDHYLKRSPLFPAAARTHAGLVGLIFRKKPTLVVDGFDFDEMAETITADGYSIEDLAEEVFSEVLITDRVGLMIDYPQTPVGLTVRQAEDAAYRPFISVYKAETILETKTTVIANRQRLSLVRLLEGEGNQIRELSLDDGIYTVRVHRKTEAGEWAVISEVKPEAQGKLIDEIPFVIVSSNGRSKVPTKAPLDDLVLTNLHLYRAQADATDSRYWLSAPILVAINTDIDENTHIGPSSVVHLKSDSETLNADLKYVESQGFGQQSLKDAITELKDECAKLGSAILASEKSAAEAAETHAIRRSSENSILSGYARSVSRKIEDALNWVVWWMSGNDNTVSFQLNCDFMPSAMDAQTATFALNALIAGSITKETFWSMLVAGELLPEDFDAELEAERLEASDLMLSRSADPFEEPEPEPEEPEAE